MKSEPVITAGVIVGVLMSFLVMAVSLGWLRLDESQMGTIEKFAVAAVPLLIALAGAWYARSKTTPVAAPKTPNGEPAVLVPQSQATPAQMAMARSAQDKAK